MSRGGFRGRGRGGGGGGMDRGMPPGGYGSFSRQEWTDAMEKLKVDPMQRGVLYPPLGNSSTAYLSGPDDHESLITTHSISLNSTLLTGKNVNTNSEPIAVGSIPPWRLAGERKVVGIEIESYSDRFNTPAQAGPSKLDPAALKLDPQMFPPVLWQEYFEGVGHKPKARPKKKRKIEDLDKEGDDVEEEETPPPSSDEDFDFDEEEEEDHQDYDANYFDNGEGDDDSGGDDDEGGGGNYDD